MVRASWVDPLDVSFSQSSPDNRWNTNKFPALYCCCSEQVAVAVAEDILGFAAVDLSDLQPEFLPQKAEISWSGKIVDVISDEGLKTIGFPSDYPKNVEKSQTQSLAEAWFANQVEGVVCRSVSLMKKGFTNWKGGHEPWSELAVYSSKAKSTPKLLSRSVLKFAPPST